MANLLFAKAVFGALSGAGTGVTNHANALTPDPKEAVFGTQTAYVDLDLGSIMSVDTFFAGFLSPEITQVQAYHGASFQARTTLDGTSVLGDTGMKRRHSLLKLGSPINIRYPSFRFATATTFSVGIVAVGLSMQPAWGHEWGSGRLIDDRSDKSPLRGGGWGIERGARVPGWQFTVGDLDQTELTTLWDMVEDVGGSAPVIVSEDPAASTAELNRSLHYGLFDRPEAYERQAPNLNRWSFRVLGWI